MSIHKIHSIFAKEKVTNFKPTKVESITRWTLLFVKDNSFNRSSWSQKPMTTICHMELLNFLWLNWVQYLPLASTQINIRFSSAHVKEIKIAIWDDVLSNSWFCLINWHLGKFGPRPGGGQRVYQSMWELRVGIGPSQATESLKFPFDIVWSQVSRSRTTC